MRAILYPRYNILNITEHEEGSIQAPEGEDCIWLDHFRNVEQEWMLPIIIQQEEAMLGIARTIQETGMTDEGKARAMAVNMLMAATLGLQYRLAPGSQEQMVAIMTMEGPWDAFREFMRRTVVAEYSARSWRLRYFLLCLGAVLTLGTLLLLD